MKNKILLFILFVIIAAACSNPQFGYPGYPDRSAELDVLPGFRNPPPGYGEVPFWWWSGDTLNTERLLGQIHELHRKGISGVQVNYSHYDTPGWLTEQDEPSIFSEDWWNVYSRISRECAKLDMGIGLSTYTIDWPRGANNLFYQLFYHKEELNAFELQEGVKHRVKAGEKLSLALTSKPVIIKTNNYAESSEYKPLPQRISVYAYPVIDNQLQQGALNLDGFVTSDSLIWAAPEGEWEVREYLAVRRPGSLNPLMPASGDTVIAGFFQKFEDHAGSAAGLNYFFNDELHIGLGKFAWGPDFADEFYHRKGYDLFEVLPAMWEEMGPITPKVRMDYADVRMSLMEERYFKPIYNWHASRGKIFGCDSGGRGLNPSEFGDYFRATRWYTAPGHDTPGGRADLIKGKVSSSIANLYQRPRVWLEGYHSLGWGATPAQLMFATRENYLYGCTLLNLHGLYYTTYGSFWEWAPPCYHFRMPYWEHMDVFLKYFERLSYLMSQGHMVTDVAVVYPVAPYEAETEPEKARVTTFDLGRKLMEAGINFEFIDHESLAKAVVEDGLLKVKEAGSEYHALVFADMSAVRWSSIEKAARFTEAGGHVYSVGTLPTASEQAGRNDPELEKMVEKAFAPARRMTNTEQTVAAIEQAFVQDVRGMGQTVRALHRKAGFRDVYMVMDAKPGTVVEFRAKGAVELWDPWTGDTRPLKVVKETETGTQVALPLEEYEANIVVFTPGQNPVKLPEQQTTDEKEILLPREWKVRFIPTMDNRWGDFRMPVTEYNDTIGIEARRFAWAGEDETLAQTAMLPATNDSLWEQKLHGFGTQFYVLGPVPQDVDIKKLEAELSRLKQVDKNMPVKVGNIILNWQPYDFSWRWGKEGDQGHQGYHGLKRTVTDDFLCLGKPSGGLNETRYVEEIEGGRYFVWSCATVEKPLMADVLFGTGPSPDKSHTSPVLMPAKVYVNGAEQKNLEEGLKLRAGSNPLLVRYDHAGRGHLVLRCREVPAPENRQPLSMRWWGDEVVIPFDVKAGEREAEWFRFVTAPGTSAIRLKALGKVEAWINGEPMIQEQDGRFTAKIVTERQTIVALRVQPETAGITGGELIPDPVMIETDGSGTMPVGDWSEYGVLHNYSGGVRYTTCIKLTEDEASSAKALDLGKVAGTAEVIVNGKRAGIRVAPPWKQEVKGLFNEGENTIEVLVFNTLANHYQTIPSRYRGEPVSGLLEPVKLILGDRL